MTSGDMSVAVQRHWLLASQAPLAEARLAEKKDSPADESGIEKLLDARGPRREQPDRSAIAVVAWTAL
jgi:hypothetical protein